MPFLLKEPGLQRRAVPVSVKTWHWMIREGLAPRRAELLRGVIVEKTSKSLLHSQLATRIFAIVQSFLSAAYWLRKEEPLTVADSEPEPDLSVVTGKDTDYQSHPSTAKLVVEVAVTTLAEDREIATIYAEAGVEEYWIINAAAREIEMHREPVNGKYQRIETCPLGQTASCLALPGVQVEVAALFAGL